MKLKKILIIDDHILFSDGLADILSVEFTDCIINLENDPEKAMSKIAVFLPCLLILDVNLKQFCGLDLLQKIREEYNEMKIVMVSVRSDRFTIESAKKFGANGYVMKNESKSGFILAINTILSGNDFYCLTPNEINSDTYTLLNGKCIKITKKEIEILHFLCQELCSKEIADKMKISENTVIGYRKSLFQKFEVKNMIGLVKYGMELGLC